MRPWPGRSRIDGVTESTLLKHFPQLKEREVTLEEIFDKSKVFYICSSGGCGSTIIFNYLKNFGNVYHVHDRYPPNKLEYIGKENTDKDVYSEWFNGVQIPEENLKNYKNVLIPM